MSKIVDLSIERAARKSGEYETYKSSDGNTFISKSLRDSYESMIQAKRDLLLFDYETIDDNLVTNPSFLLKIRNIEEFKLFVSVYRKSLGLSKMEIIVELEGGYVSEVSGVFFIEQLIEPTEQGPNVIILRTRQIDGVISDLKERINQIENF